jgi:hypothetical protein
MYPNLLAPTSFKYPLNHLLPLQGIIKDDELRYCPSTLAGLAFKINTSLVHPCHPSGFSMIILLRPLFRLLFIKPLTTPHRSIT